MWKTILGATALLLPAVALAKPTVVKPGEMWTRVKTDSSGVAEVEIPLTGNETSRLSITVAGGDVANIKASETRKALKRQRLPRAWPLKIISQEKLLDSMQDRASCLELAKEDPGTEVLEFESWDKLGLSPELYEQFKAVFTQIHNELGGYVGPGRCGKISGGSMAQLTQLFFITFEGAWSPQITCQFIDSPFLDASYVYFGVVQQQQSSTKQSVARRGSLPRVRLGKEEEFSLGTYITTVFKNACEKQSKRPYLVRLRIQLKKRSATSIAIGIEESKFDGKKGATIKPVSEGRFAPNPLLLMEMTRQCGVKVTETVWRNGKPKFTSLKPEDLIRFHERVFVRVNMGGRMQGGKASYDLTDADTGYGVCFNRQAVRQYANDYPMVSGGDKGDN